MSDTVHIRIKKDYAAAIIKDLEKMDAIEMLPNTDDIPDWHMQVVNERLAEYKENPKLGLDFDDAMDDIERDL